MATTLEIVRGIQQAAVNGYDGALDEDGNRVEIGLKREEGHLINDSRVVDGFGIKFHGNKLIVTYQSEVSFKEVKSGQFQNEVEGMIEQIVKFLKKEYKKITGSTLSLKKDADADILVQNLSSYRTWCQAQMPFVIGGLDEVEGVAEGSPEDRLESSIKKFLKLGKGPKPKNVTRRND